MCQGFLGKNISGSGAVCDDGTPSGLETSDLQLESVFCKELDRIYEVGSHGKICYYSVLLLQPKNNH